MGWQQDGAHGAAHRSSDRRLGGQLAITPDRRVGAWLSRRLFCPLAGQPGESNHRSSRRPTRCIAMRCRPHRERAHLPPAGSSWIVAALAPSSAVRTARPVTPTVKLVAVTARGEQEPRPGRLDAAEARGRTPGRPGCRPGAQAPRRSGGRAPARAYPSSGAPAGGRAPERGCDCPARPPPAVTLSDAGGQGECARSRRSAWSPRLDSSVLGLRKVG
jgi:hypothetical protein